MEYKRAAGALYAQTQQNQIQNLTSDFQNQPLPMNLVEQLHLAVQNHIAPIQNSRHAENPINMSDNHLSQDLRTNHSTITLDDRRQNINHDILRTSSLAQELHRASPLAQDIHRNSPAVQNMSQELHRNTPEVLSQELHRSTPDVLTQDVRTIEQRIQNQMVQMVPSRLAMSNVIMDGQRGQQMVLPFQIKSEQDTDENTYFYDPLSQATFSSNGTVPIEHAASNIASNLHDTHPLQAYIFNSHIPNANVPALSTVDPYVRSQMYVHNYNTNENSNAQNLVIHRQYENVNYVTQDMKRERDDMVEKLHHSISHNENMKPIEIKNYYDHYDQSTECYLGKSENDAGVQNKMTGDVAYKSLIEAEYANIKGEYVCFKCNGIFPSKRCLKQHGKSCPEDIGETSEKANKFGCNQCPYKCQSPAILKIHERTHTGEKPFSCNFCDYKSGQKNNVAKHILVHMKEKPFRCQYCDYRCAQKNNLVVHERTHTGFKPFACTLCDYKTVQKPNLVKHMYLHTGQKPFSCDVCTYRCVQKTNLTKHKQRHLNEKNGEKPDYVNKNANRPYRPRQKTFKCDYCPFKSVQKNGLDKHVQFKHASDQKTAHEQLNESVAYLAQKTYDIEIQGLNLTNNEIDVDKEVQNLCLRKSEVYTETNLGQENMASVQIQT